MVPGRAARGRPRSARSIAYPGFELTSHLGTVAVSPRLRAASPCCCWRSSSCGCAGISASTTSATAALACRWRRFLSVSLRWGALGIATAAVGAAFLLATDLRVVTDPASLGSAATLSHLLLAGLASGISVALIEETVFRGAMHTAIARESGPWSAALLTAPLFAILHFFAKASIPPEQLDCGSGFDLLVRSFAPAGSSRAW